MKTNHNPQETLSIYYPIRAIPVDSLRRISFFTRQRSFFHILRRLHSPRNQNSGEGIPLGRFRAGGSSPPEDIQNPPRNIVSYTSNFLTLFQPEHSNATADRLGGGISLSLPKLTKKANI